MKVISICVFTGTVSVSTPLSTQIRFVFLIIWTFKKLSHYNEFKSIWVDNGVDTETVPVNTQYTSTYHNKEAFHWGAKVGKISLKNPGFYWIIKISVDQ